MTVAGCTVIDCHHHVGSLEAQGFTFAGAACLIVGAGGFIPAMVAPHSHPDVTVTSGLGLELSMFPINVLHNIVHLLFGVWGLLASRSDAGSRRPAAGPSR